MDLASDLAMMIRNISSEVSGGALKSTALYGRVVGYHQDSNNMVVAIPHYVQANGTVPQIHVPIGCFMAGNGYGDYFYAETGQLCLLLVMEADTGDTIHGFLLNDAANPPPNLGGDPNTPRAPLEAGERIIIGRNGQIIRFAANGDLQLVGVGNARLGSRADGGANFGTTPVAVEGSTSTHDHDLSIFVTAFAGVLNAIMPPVPLTTNALGGILTSLLTPGVATNIFAATIDSKGGGPLAAGTGGAQTVLAPGPGES